MPRIDAALTRFTRGDIRGTIGALVAIWRKAPDPRLGDLIDALDARLDEPAIDPQALRVRSLADATMRIDGLQKLGRDPRVTTALLHLLADAPFTSNSSRSLWQKVLGRLGAQEDPRVLLRIAEVKSKWAMRSNQRKWLEAQVDATVARLRPSKKAPKVDAASLARFESALGQAPRAQPSTTADGELLASIYANPADDALRSVYADWLSDRGNPRGEFIAMQLRPERKVRERSLLKKHEREWIGPIAPVVAKKDVEFARGFLVACHVLFKNERDVREHGTDPAWSTVERMRHGFPGAGPGEQMKWITWIHPVMRSLRDVDLYAHSARMIRDSRETWNLEHVRWGTWRYGNHDDDSLALLASTGKLPKLTRLSLPYLPAPGWLAGADFAKTLRELTIDYPYNAIERIEPLLREVWQLPAFERLVFDTGRFRLDIERDVARARVQPQELRRLIDLLGAFPERSLAQRLEVDAPDAPLVFIEGDLRALREAARRVGVTHVDTPQLGVT